MNYEEKMDRLFEQYLTLNDNDQSSVGLGLFGGIKALLLISEITEEYTPEQQLEIYQLVETAMKL